MGYDPFYPESADEIKDIAQSRKHIPSDVFPEVRKLAYTPTADIIPTRYGSRGFEFLLTKRRETPWAGQWFSAGGRILPGEVPEEGMVRVCGRELGFFPRTADTRFMLWQSVYNPECNHGGEGYFVMGAFWQVWVEFAQEIVLDPTLIEYKWFTLAEAKDEVLSVYVEKAIKGLLKDPTRGYCF